MEPKPEQAAPQEALSKASETLTWTTSTYFGQGLPWTLLHQVAVELFTAVGLPTHVGYLSALHWWASAVKLVFSPIIEFYGTLKRWLVGTQIGLGVLVGLLALAAERLGGTSRAAEGDTVLVWPLLALIGLLSAGYDIACDGYYLARLGPADQARYAGTRVMAFRFAMIVGSSGLVVLAGRRGWLYGFGAAAALLFALALLHAYGLAEASKSTAVGGRAAPSKASGGTGEVPAVSSASSRLGGHARAAYRSFLTQERVLSVIAFLLTYKLADVLMFAMTSVLMADELGLPTDLRGVLRSLGIGASILGAILGGAWIAKKTLKGTLFVITLAMAVTEPLFALVAHYAPLLQVAVPGSIKNMDALVWDSALPKLCVIAGVLVVEQFCGGLATAAQAVFIMRRCHPQHRAAHFAFATAIYSVSQGLVGVLSGHLYLGVGPVAFFWVASVLTLPAIAISRRVPTD